MTIQMWNDLKEELEQAIEATEMLRKMMPESTPLTELDAFRKILERMHEMEAETDND